MYRDEKKTEIRPGISSSPIRYNISGNTGMNEDGAMYFSPFFIPTCVYMAISFYNKHFGLHEQIG